MIVMFIIIAPKCLTELFESMDHDTSNESIAKGDLDISYMDDKYDINEYNS
jgi:hypothetical protein